VKNEEITDKIIRAMDEVANGCEEIGREGFKPLVF